MGGHFLNETGAFRHAILAATLSNRYGEENAWQVLMRHEEGLGTFDPRQRYFTSGQSADTAVDMYNNFQGIKLGLRLGQTTDMNFVAGQVLDHWKEHGLYTAKEYAPNQWRMERSFLSQEKYDALRGALSRKDENGEWK